MGIHDFKKGYQPRTSIVKKRKVILLQTATMFGLGEGTVSLSYWMYMWLTTLGSQKYIQQSH